MKRAFLLLLAISSCLRIDNHYYSDFRGEWFSTQESFGTYASEVFLRITEDSVDVFIDGEPIGKGTYYKSDGQLVMGWGVETNGMHIVFHDATLTIDNRLLLRWRPIEQFYAYTSVFEK